MNMHPDPLTPTVGEVAGVIVFPTLPGHVVWSIVELLWHMDGFKL